MPGGPLPQEAGHRALQRDARGDDGREHPQREGPVGNPSIGEVGQPGQMGYQGGVHEPQLLREGEIFQGLHV